MDPKFCAKNTFRYHHIATNGSDKILWNNPIKWTSAGNFSKSGSVMKSETFSGNQLLYNNKLFGIRNSPSKKA